MRRRLFRILSALSLLLCMGAMVMWPVSCWTSGAVYAGRGSWGVWLGLQRGSMAVITLWSHNDIWGNRTTAGVGSFPVIYQDTPPRWNVLGIRRQRLVFVLEAVDTHPSLVVNAYTFPF